MKEIVAGLAQNLVYILIAIFLLQIWSDRKDESIVKQRRALFITMSLSLLFCITFSIRLNSDIIFDLRHIPFILGGLYGGTVVSLLLFILASSYRALFGGLGAYINIVELFIFLIPIILLSKNFMKYNIRKRLLINTVLSLLFSICTMIILESTVQFTFETFHIWVSYLLIQTIGMLIVSITFEMIHKNYILRQRVVRAEKLEAVSHIAASIAHEIRNPLTTSRGFMQLLKEAKLEDRLTYYIDLSMNEMDRAEEIIRDYLTLARPAPEKVDKLDLKLEVDSVIDVVQPLAHMNNVVIDAKLDSALVIGESLKVKQCLVNILKNSIEAMTDGGTLFLSVVQKNDCAYLTIKDEGVGMTAEQIKRLGEPYFSTKESKGTGLGMMVVFRIIEAMKGKIEITSQIGIGTTLLISFPLYKENG